MSVLNEYLPSYLYKKELALPFLRRLFKLVVLKPLKSIKIIQQSKIKIFCFCLLTEAAYGSSLCPQTFYMLTLKPPNVKKFWFAFTPPFVFLTFFDGIFIEWILFKFKYLKYEYNRENSENNANGIFKQQSKSSKPAN